MVTLRKVFVQISISKINEWNLLNHYIFFNFPDLMKDDLVILINDEQFVKSELNQSNFDWDDKMKLMLGKTFSILEIKGQFF